MEVNDLGLLRNIKKIKVFISRQLNIYNHMQLKKGTLVLGQHVNE
jgi:hypothetical protein